MPAAINLIGLRQGSLTVEESESVHGVKMWRSRCDCGNVVVRKTTAYTVKKISSCRKCSMQQVGEKQQGKERDSYRAKTESRYRELIDTVKGEFLTIKEIYRSEDGKWMMAKCLCICGQTIERRINALLRPTAVYQSCGCRKYQFRRDAKEHFTTHVIAYLRSEAETSPLEHNVAPYDGASFDPSMPSPFGE